MFHLYNDLLQAVNLEKAYFGFFLVLEWHASHMVMLFVAFCHKVVFHDTAIFSFSSVTQELCSFSTSAPMLKH